MSKEFSKRAKEIIAQITYINIASVTADGLPWNSPVFAAYDDEYNFYFGTHKGSQKAKNIDANPNVFVTIYDSTIPPGDGEGVYMQAKAIRLSKPAEIGAAHAFLWPKYVVPYWTLEEFEEPTPLALYKIVPEKVWINDEGKADGHYIDTRTEIRL